MVKMAQTPPPYWNSQSLVLPQQMTSRFFFSWECLKHSCNVWVLGFGFVFNNHVYVFPTPLSRSSLGLTMSPFHKYRGLVPLGFLWLSQDGRQVAWLAKNGFAKGFNTPVNVLCAICKSDLWQAAVRRTPVRIALPCGCCSSSICSVNIGVITWR